MVERCRRGNRQAQQEVYSRTSGRIYRLLLNLTGSPEDAFDLAQDTYVRGFSRMARFGGRCSLSTWLYRIAVNEAMQFLRHRRMAKKKMKSLQVDDRVESEGERSTVKLDVNSALARLEPADRLMLLLRYREGLDYRAIAEVVGCAEGTVGSRLNRASGRLRRQLGDGYAPPEEIASLKHQNRGGRSGRRVKRGSDRGKRPGPAELSHGV